VDRREVALLCGRGCAIATLKVVVSYLEAVWCCCLLPGLALLMSRHEVDWISVDAKGPRDASNHDDV
jgi:hypothetical protein